MFILLGVAWIALLIRGIIHYRRWQAGSPQKQFKIRVKCHVSICNQSGHLQNTMCHLKTISNFGTQSAEHWLTSRSWRLELSPMAPSSTCGALTSSMTDYLPNPPKIQHPKLGNLRVMIPKQHRHMEFHTHSTQEKKHDHFDTHRTPKPHLHPPKHTGNIFHCNYCTLWTPLTLKYTEISVLMYRLCSAPFKHPSITQPVNSYVPQLDPIQETPQFHIIASHFEPSIS